MVLNSTMVLVPHGIDNVPRVLPLIEYRYHMVYHLCFLEWKTADSRTATVVASHLKMTSKEEHNEEATGGS